MVFRSRMLNLLTFCGTACLLSACGSSTAATNPDKSTGSRAADAAAVSPYKPTATFQEIMDSIVDPSSDVIWEAVSTTVDAKGIHEKQPHTDAEWHEFRRRAILLVEAANLIAVPGRRVAKGDKSVEDGAPL